MKKSHKKILIALGIFAAVFIPFGIAIAGGWFCIDDLGVILNGLISKFSDVGKILTDDSRNYATTYNYNLPKSNVVSGFLRPLQQFFFSLIYHTFGLNLLAFQLLQVFFHAANAALVFLLFSYWLPLSFSCIGSLLFAFYPNMTWLSWLCTLQHSLTLFFLLLAILLFVPMLHSKKIFYKNSLFYLSGFSFFLSLLARETHMFLAPWAALAIFLFYTDRTSAFFARCKISLAKTSLFFLGSFVYFCMRVYAFGFASLIRTIRNVLIRFPFLARFLTTPASPQKVTTVAAKATTVATKAITTAAATVDTATHTAPSFFSSLGNKFFTWTSIIFNHAGSSWEHKLLIVLLVCFFSIMLFAAYKKEKRGIVFLLLGLPLFLWPCILVYPAPRYMSTAYPLFIFIGLYALHAQGITLRCATLHRKKSFHSASALFFLFAALSSIIHGFQQNIISQARMKKYDTRKKTYKQFFIDHNIPKGSHLIFISTLDEADLEQQLQAVSHDFSLKVAHVVISKLAEKGKYGLPENCRIHGVSYEITPIENGFRFTSLDKNHCGWAFHSYQPVVWSQLERAYVLAPTFFKKNVWYDFSMGKFLTHEIQQESYVTDVTFVFDKKWLTSNTKFVVWDTMEGRYKVL